MYLLPYYFRGFKEDGLFLFGLLVAAKLIVTSFLEILKNIGPGSS